MHAPLQLLAGVVAAAANSPVTPPVSTAAPSSASPPASTSLHTPLPRIAPVSPAPDSNLRAPSPMLSAPIPHLASPPSPPSDVTGSTAALGPPSSGGRPQKRAKVRSVKAQKRVLKRPFEAASVPVEKDAASADKGAKDDKGDDDSQDNKRAMRAERNRQSAAASRERKKRHIKDLEERVKYLTEVNSTLQYRLDLEKQTWEEKEMVLQQEIARLRHQLSRESAFRPSPPQNHPMTLHHLTHRGPVTY